MANQLPRAALLTLSVLAVLGTAAQARSWSPGDYPNPDKDPAECGRADVATGRSRICDADGVLSAKSRDVVEGIIQASTPSSSRTSMLYNPMVASEWSLGLGTAWHAVNQNWKQNLACPCRTLRRAGRLTPPWTVTRRTPATR